MALQPCRTALARGRHAARFLAPSLRASLGTDAAPPTGETDVAAAAANNQLSSGLPRWSHTPPAMKAPLQMDFAKKAKNKIWAVNNDPERLDDMYERLLGPRGKHMLPDELKWLAVTHKSFDQGRRGFNDRLALMGRVTLLMETTKYIVSKTPNDDARAPDEFGRQPFEHPQLAPVDNLNAESPRDVVGKDKLYGLAHQVGLVAVMRWKPRIPDRLYASGIETVMSAAIMAIVGAITLQHGSVVASEVVRKRILDRVRILDRMRSSR
ncbi:hypothetical protein CDD83_7807 [Cordyceps sp. RAO-2017]|nr:hypothetical protein CDD83_7807 [Cordyceps sp. RAO-2017]